MCNDVGIFAAKETILGAGLVLLPAFFKLAIVESASRSESSAC
jgi:hypothetical protein